MAATAKKLRHARNTDPRIKSLADELGLRIFRRDGELWANGDYQLTYKFQVSNGRQKALGESERIELAVDLLEKVKHARAHWPSIELRHAKIIDGLENEVLPEYRDRHYNIYRDESLDEGWMIRTWISPKWEMGVDLVGCGRLRVCGETPQECFAQLRSQVPKVANV